MENGFRKNIIELALLQLGKPYVWGERGPLEFDCSGLTYYIFQELFGIDINEAGYGIGDTTKQMTNNIGNLQKYSEDDPKKEDYLKYIQVGDLVFFHRQSLEENQPTPSNRYPGHVGIYLGENKFLHASSDDLKVVISEFDEYWLKVLVGSRDIVCGILDNLAT